MAEREQLFRINFRSKRTGYGMFLLVWGVDAMDALVKIAGIVGPGAEYELEGLSAQLEQEKPVYRAAQEVRP